MKPVKYQPYSSHRKLIFKNDLGCFVTEREAERYRVLTEMVKRGSINNLQCHVTFTLLEPVYNSKVVRKVLKTKVKIAKKKICVEQGVTLDVSFVYRNKKGKLRVEVVKNKRDYQDPTYIIKRKLMRYLYNIVLVENQ